MLGGRGLPAEAALALAYISAGNLLEDHTPMTDAATLLANAQRPELSVSVYLGAPNLVHERVELQQQDTRTRDEQATLDDLVRQINAATLTTRVRAIPHREWNTLIVDHPPRDGVAEDRRQGFNTSTFWAAVVPLCLPDLTRDQYEQLDAVLSEGEWVKICEVVEAVNTRTVIIPKLPADSPTSPASERT